MRMSFCHSPATCFRLFLTALIVGFGATMGGARQVPSEPEIEPWLGPGTVVVLKDSETPLRDREWLATSRDHLTFVIEHVEGERLLVASRDQSQGGWLRRDQVVALDEAIDYFTREIDRIPHHADAYWMRGRVWAYRAEDDRAIADFDQAIQLQPHQARFYVRRALVLVRRRHLDKALADCDKAIQLDPQDAAAYVLRSSIRLLRGETQQAQADLNRALRLDPLEAPDQPVIEVQHDSRERDSVAAGARLLLALKMEEAQRAGIPADDADKAAEREPKTVPELLDRGLTWLNQKEYNRAIADFTRAIQLDPNSAKAYVYRAEAWGARHHRDQELADLDEAIRLEPKNIQYRLSRATSWSAQGRHEQAMADYNVAIQLEPNNPLLYVARGNEWRRHVKLDLALADYDRAIQLDPKYIQAYISRALISKQRRDFAQAVVELAAIARMAPENAEVHRLIARILATCNDNGVRDGNRAVREAIRACELTHWTDPDCLDTLAAAYAEIGEYPLAVQWQKKAIELVRHNVPSTLQKAMFAGGRRGVGFEDRLAFYKRNRPCRE